MDLALTVGSLGVARAKLTWRILEKLGGEVG